jgi:hypothetical protein
VYIRAVDALLPQRGDFRLQVVAPEVKFVAAIFSGGMDCGLRRR